MGFKALGVLPLLELQLYFKGKKKKPKKKRESLFPPGNTAAEG